MPESAHLTDGLTIDSSMHQVFRAQIEWLRRVAAEKELDVGKLILGKTLNKIIGDDANHYHVSVISELPSDVRRKMGEEMLKHLKFESSLPEMPDKVKDKLNWGIEGIEEFDWGDDVEFDLAGARLTTVNYETRGMIENSPELQEAMEYFEEKWESLNPLWNKILEERGMA